MASVESAVPQCFTNGTSHDHKNGSDEVVAKINLTIDETNVIEGARDVLKVIRPQWNSNDIKFKVRLEKSGCLLNENTDKTRLFEVLQKLITFW